MLFLSRPPIRSTVRPDLRLDQKSDAFSVITAGQTNESELIARIVASDEELVMPPPDAHKELSPKEIDVLTRWVEEGANWSQHWSFAEPRNIAPPNHRENRQLDTSTLQPIDAFVSARLAEQGLALTNEASREKVIRRVTFDLTGMPPTLTEVDAFLADPSPQSYEKVVDRLLNSPRYGQRMALMWLDAARYGDTSVYHADGPRDMWAWRDAIVDAYNQNMPFDEFSIRQIAGDLLPDATIQQKVLAGFNRNNGTTDEGGAIAEEYRVEYCVDRVKTTSTVWLGLTMECAQCHDHKYDPISQEDYYRFYAFFNVSSDGGMQTRKGNANPILSIPDPQREAQLPGAKQNLAGLQQRLKQIETDCTSSFLTWLAKSQTDSTKITPSLDGCLVNVPLNEGEGTIVSGITATEASPLNGTIRGTPEWKESRSDGGLHFKGSQSVDLGDVANFERTDSFSFGGWVKPDKDSGQGALLAKMDSSNAFRGFDVLLGDRAISVHIINTWPGNAIKVTTKESLKADTWQHVYVTYDGSSKAKGIKIYVDGKIWDWKIEQNGLSETIQTEKTLLIGSRHGGSPLKATVDDVQVYDRELSASEIQSIAERSTVDSLLAITPDERTEPQTILLRKHYLSTQNPDYQATKKQLTSTQAMITELEKPLTTVMVMGDMGKPRETFILNRGAYDSPTDKRVTPGTPSILPPLDDITEDEADDDAQATRLSLARWLFRDDHPLTARVAVNRYWQMLFGIGLVSTPEDYGAQGDFPSHPELLDWLANDFRQSGWNVKRFLKKIVLSKTYRQSSRATPEAYAQDPSNRLLARGPRFRLQGEFLRDAALSISGLLCDQYGGPGVKPYQPPGLWAEVGLGANPKFKQDQGDDLVRRSLYTYWKRSAPPPAMQIFDAPTREKCTIRRARTNTPLQALVTMNDDQFVEAARNLAQRMILEGGRTNATRIQFGFRLATSRFPNETENRLLGSVLQSSLEHYQADQEAATNFLDIGESPREQAIAPAHHAAWTIVASAILNLDETLTRE